MQEQEEIQIHRTRGWIGTLVTIFFVVLFGAFVWRVVFYMQAIRSGEVNFADLNFNETVSTIASLASKPISTEAIDVISADDPSLGNPNAKVTIVEFADFGCPFSREASVTMRMLAQEYPDQFRYIYRDFPILELHPLAQKAAEAGECAAAQGKFWEYHDKLYQNQNDLDESSFELFASAINLDTEKFRTCFSQSTYAEEVAKDIEDGIAAGVRGTPTFFINGNRVAGSIPKDILEKVIVSLNAPTTN